MRSEVDVKSLDALRDAKNALVEFREVCGVALSESYADVHRTVAWLQNDRRMYWQTQIRKRNETLAQAKSELFRAQLSATESNPTCMDQKRAVAKAERGVAEAHEKVNRIKKWLMLLDREVMLFKGQCQQMARTVEGDIPRGEARLELLMDKLDKYMQVRAPESGPRRRSGSDGSDDQGREGSTGSAKDANAAPKADGKGTAPADPPESAS